jgi:hypothetical protein
MSKAYLGPALLWAWQLIRTAFVNFFSTRSEKIWKNVRKWTNRMGSTTYSTVLQHTLRNLAELLLILGCGEAVSQELDISSVCVGHANIGLQSILDVKSRYLMCEEPSAKAGDRRNILLFRQVVFSEAGSRVQKIGDANKGDMSETELRNQASEFGIVLIYHGIRLFKNFCTKIGRVYLE